MQRALGSAGRRLEGTSRRGAWLQPAPSWASGLGGDQRGRRESRNGWGLGSQDGLKEQLWRSGAAQRSGQ